MPIMVEEAIHEECTQTGIAIFQHYLHEDATNKIWEQSFASVVQVSHAICLGGNKVQNVMGNSKVFSTSCSLFCTTCHLW
jgi:hypothetical protein